MRGLTALVAAAALAGSLASCAGGHRRADIVIGATSTTATATEPPITAAPAPRAGGGGGTSLADANGAAYDRVLAFSSSIPVPSDLVFILVAGSDARPKDNLLRSHADSLHLLAVNPRTMQATSVGIPRDSWVDIPGHGKEKITMALARGGPDLLVETVHRLTNLPIHYWVLTGFRGLSALVDELGGVNVFVEQRMNDSFSGARFEPGWHHFNGAQALAFSRNRHDVPNGDFGRSLNQGKLVVAMLAKMRAEVGDEGGLRRWVGILFRHVAIDAPLERVVALGALARRLDVAAVNNMVLPGRIGTAGSQSVVYLGAEAANVFVDLRPDAVIGSAGPEQTTSTTGTTSTTATTAPPPGSPTTTTVTTAPPPSTSTTVTTIPVPGP